MLASRLLYVAVAAFSSTLVNGDALPKANEYTAGDCSGYSSYPHKSPSLKDVTMDDTTHSVYLATPNSGAIGFLQWQAFSGKTSNGGSCTGKRLGSLGGECQNLDTVFGERVNCVRLCEVTNDGEPFADVYCFDPA